MSENHTITPVDGKWEVYFKQRAFTRCFDSESDAKIVAAADSDYFEAEKVGLYSVSRTDPAKDKKLAAKLRDHAVLLKEINGLNSDTIRWFEQVADRLEG